ANWTWRAPRQDDSRNGDRPPERAPDQGFEKRTRAPLHERGFRGLAYQTLGSANKDFIRVCGKACEGVVLAAGPVLVADQLPADHPARGPGVAYWQAYEAAYGKGTVTTFGAFVWDVGIMLEAAIPEALKRGKPGTEEFRAALRDAIEGISNLPIAHGVKTHTPTDHSGLDERGRVLVKIVNGEWVFDGKQGDGGQN